MSTNTLSFIGAFVLIAICLFLAIKTEIRMSKIFKGRSASSLEDLMQQLVDDTDILKQTSDKHSAFLSELSERIGKLGRGVKIMRFNPFKDVGGNQSFATAIVNEDGDGIVISSLYSRERMSVFAKPVMKGVSDIELSAEEKAVILEAQKETAQKEK